MDNATSDKGPRWPASLQRRSVVYSKSVSTDDRWGEPRMRVGYRVGLVLLALLAFAVGESGLLARQAAWQPSLGHTQLPIWPGVVPDARPVDGPEVAGWVEDPADRAKKHLVGGKPWTYVDKVSQP